MECEACGIELMDPNDVTGSLCYECYWEAENELAEEDEDDE